MPFPVRFLQLSLTLTMAACGGRAEAGDRSHGTAAPAAGEEAPTLVMLCGADTISVAGGARDTLELRVHGETFTVVQVPAASGARYQAPDSGTFFWSHGTQATVQVRGDALPACDPVVGLPAP